MGRKWCTVITLTPHFELEEFERTGTRLVNVAPQIVVVRLKLLCAAILEPLREKTGPLRITSGYRSAQVNEAVGSKSKNSQHLTGQACDCVPLKMKSEQAFEILYDMSEHGLPVDQAILYPKKGHIHISFNADEEPRRQFMIHSKGKYKKYRRLDNGRDHA